MIFLTKEYWSNINEAHTRNKGICFENLVKKLLNAEYGNAVFQETRESWDGSRDFYYYSQQRKYWAECKNYASNIDLKVLASTLIMAQLSEIDTILYYSYSMTIYQPRRQNVSTYEISKDDLYRWADEVLKPTADLAFAGDGNFLCGEWCGFCKAKNECRARAEANLKLTQHDFKLPPLLTDTEIEVILGKVDELVSWASDIKEYALQQALSGKEWTGFKIVEGRSNRRYSNEAAVIDAVEKAGFDPYEKKLLGITAMQKLLGKSRFDELLTAYIEKPQGKPTLVPDSDKRPAMNTAKNDFMEENDNE